MPNRFLTKQEVDDVAELWMDAIRADLTDNPLPIGEERSYPNPMGRGFVPLVIRNTGKLTDLTKGVS